MDSVDPPGARGPGDDAVSVAAERARERLHAEIERVRTGVEEMLAEQDAGGAETADLRRRLDEIGAEARAYAKRRVRKSERRLERSIEKLEARTGELENRLEEAEQDRRYAEWRIHTTTEQMLDGLLREVRTIADLLSRTR